MLVKIKLDTIKDIKDFVEIVSNFTHKISLTDGEGMKVNAKSLIGVMYTTEWDNVYCESKEDISRSISKFISI